MLHKGNKDTIILGIESSCDDTSVSIAQNNRILSNIVSNQKVHKEYGGVIPELASREHQKNIIPTISLAIKKAKISMDDIDAIAFTRGPGLMGSLLVGSSFAKSLALSLNIPLIEVNHMEAHVIANFIDHIPEFPLICLTVSGGHTQIVKVESVKKINILGETLDDSAGETFDKCAKILGLNYPGGPEIEKKAKYGNPLAFTFTKPKVKNLNFSFSGLKTNFLQLIKKESTLNNTFIQDNIEDLCASIQSTIIEILLNKLNVAIIKYKPKNIAISGGVAANEKFRQSIKKLEEKYRLNVLIPKKEYATDNAAMIALSGYYKYKENALTNLEINVDPRYHINRYSE
ncbi:MAG: tRNA (adenosine(37)-N6)-threonylcarbamoyltransferase complex transferase subunit TsaD [Flavobacteriales bacterium]|nr:tRNA (adenosine(37)-N6)-threonylcarbamoyltransferase complex transferase subunit TsaD [Flavobacteriales bacterium]|tara:strand:- start:14972 stop:16006 length:1035 start_codon:yes stop_codon:yes gene_type:complete